MCGIAGFYLAERGSAADDGVLRRMCDAIVHRGPDSEGRLTRDGVAIGMRRLKIIDLAGGDQPIFNEDGSIAVVFNGEIYNYRDLRRELELAGHRFRTSSDTEVLVHLYEEHGEAMLQRLNGMFAFSLVDFPRRRVLLARDRFGVKPLFFAATGGEPRGWAWASEIKALLHYPGVARKVRADGLSDFLSLNYMPPGTTLFEGIEQLLPGELAVLDERGLRRRTWWDLRFEPATSLTEAAACERLLHLLEDSVRLRLVSDVPFGAFLSGGVDSSAVVAMMSRHMREPVKTFSIGFEERSFNELPYARAVARRYGTEHHEVVIRPDLAELLPWLVWHSEEPTADSSALAVLFVSHFARRHVTMALSGDGGDELFAGYETYNAFYARDAYRRLPRWVRRGVVAPLVRALPVSDSKVSFDFKARRFVQGAELSADAAHFFWRTIFTEEAKRDLLAPTQGGPPPETLDEWIREQEGPDSTYGRHRHYFDAAGTRDPLARMLYVDTRFYLPSDMLIKVDRMSMAVSLEAREPFLDYRLAELAASIPSDVKFRGRVRKYLLKRALAPHLDHDILHRRKAGFNLPVNVWLKGPLRTLLEDTLSPTALGRHGLFRREAVRSLIDQHVAGAADRSFELWGLLVFQMWHDQFVSGTPQLRSLPKHLLDASLVDARHYAPAVSGDREQVLASPRGFEPLLPP